MINKLIETIKYYLAVLWLRSPIYIYITLPNKIIEMKAFKYISKSYKNKLIYNKFNMN